MNETAFSKWERTVVLSAGDICLLLLSLGVLMVLAMACSSGRVTQTFEVTPTLDPEFVEFEVRNPVSNSQPEPDQEDQRYGGVLRYPTIGLLIPDPAIGPEGDSALLLAEVYSGLTKISAQGTETGLPYELDLAERVEIDTTGTKYEFLLKRDIKYSDGTPVLASHFKWAWERALNPRTVSRRAQSILGGITGAEDVIDGQTIELTGVRIVDDRTFEIHLDEARFDFPALLADPVASVLNPENVKRWGVEWSEWAEPYSQTTKDWIFDELPIGTGPFRITEFDYIEGICILERNPYYIHENVFLDRVEFVSNIIPSNANDITEHLARAFADELIDVITLSSSTDIIDVESSKYREKIIVSQLRPFSEFLLLNPNNSPLSDSHLRKALASSVNLMSFSRLLQPNLGDRLVPHVTHIESIPDRRVFDLELAIAEFEKSIYAENSENIQLLFENPYTVPNVLATFQEWREILGIHTNIEIISPNEYSLKSRSKSLDMMYHRIELPYADAYTVFSVFEGLDDELDELLQLAKGEMDLVERLELLNQIDIMIFENSLVIPYEWLSGTVNTLVQPWVYGYVEPQFHGSRFAKVWFDETAPTR